MKYQIIGETATAMSYAESIMEAMKTLKQSVVEQNDYEVETDNVLHLIECMEDSVRTLRKLTRRKRTMRIKEEIEDQYGMNLDEVGMGMEEIRVNRVAALLKKYARE